MDILKLYILFALIGALVYGICRLLRLKPVFSKIEKPKRSALCSLIAVSVCFLIIFALMLLSYKHGPTHAPTHGTGHGHHRNLLGMLLLQLILFVPVIFMLRRNGETLQSIGITRANLWKATVVGLFLSATTLFFGHGGPSAALKLTEGHDINTLIYFSFVGFGEEILYRGYLQSRLIAWLGHNRGWVLTSIIMALVHVPQRLVTERMGIPHALLSSLELVPVSLLMGFVMLRTGNVVSGGLFHTFCNWAGAR